jgi:hypothetical protein
MISCFWSTPQIDKITVDSNPLTTNLQIIVLHKIDKNVEREIINHQRCLHPNIVRFIEVRGSSSDSCQRGLR